MKTNKLVKFPNGDYVNPTYVTLIELVKSNGTLFTRAWVISDAGYNTKSIEFLGDCRQQLADLLNT